MITSSQIDLARYRLTDAKEKLESTKILLQEKQFKDSLSRSYYAMFSAVRSLLALKELDSSKHSGVISLFNQHFVKPNLIDASFGRMLKKAQYSRERTDYGDYVLVTLDEA
jgi:uncharacterized protein (UPF0332 family)